jgi:hypothetical protein
MKLFSSLILSTLLLATVAKAQSDATTTEPTLSKARGNKVGIGLAIAPSGSFLLTDDDGLISFIPLVLRVPVHFSSVKLEPELGVYTAHTREDEEPADFSDRTATLLRVGAGMFYNTPVSSDASVYVGPKVGIMTLSTVSENKSSNSFEPQTMKSETSQTNIFFGANVGGEYFFSTHFSIGAEIGLEYVSKGNEESKTTFTPADPDPFPTPETTTSGSEFLTKSALTARFYF